MKARTVKGLDPDATLADNLERIVATRLDELCSFVPRALDPARVKALHAWPIQPVCRRIPCLPRQVPWQTPRVFRPPRRCMAAAARPMH